VYGNCWQLLFENGLLTMKWFAIPQTIARIFSILDFHQLLGI